MTTQHDFPGKNPALGRARLISTDPGIAAPRFRRRFSLLDGHGTVRRARLSITAHGVIEAWLNGTPVSDEVLTPGWSSYEWRLRYRTYDVTRLLSGENMIGLAVGNGWWRGHLGWIGDTALYGTEIGAIAALEIEYADDHHQLITTDDSWQASPGPVEQNDLYDGETIDARSCDPAWSTTDDDQSPVVWTAAITHDHDAGVLTPYVGPPIRRQESRDPVRARRTGDGRVLLDFGQNLVGWLRIEIRGPRGTELTVRHAEVLENGELATRPLRAAKATDRFVLSGADDVFEPTFTYHGFRYAEITGWPDDVPIDGHIRAVIISSDLRRRGWFECSNPELSRLHENIYWTARGNFVDLPTDCPQRDERLGWTGDIALFTPTASFLFDVRGFLGDWLLDLAAEQQHADGRVPYTIPDAIKLMSFRGDGDGHPIDTIAIWSDAAVWVPWAMWQAYGEREILVQQYASIRAHALAIAARLCPSGLWDTGYQLGDWLDPTAPPDQPDKAMTDKYLVATACAYRTFGISSRIAELLGRSEDAARFAELGGRTRRAFRTAYLSDGLMINPTTTAYALAIHFGLFDPAELPAAGQALARIVGDHGHTVSTGLAGTAFVLDALCAAGREADAVAMMLQRKPPSWLYAVAMGATTIWERWDSLLPDGTVNPGGMTSFNHYALGSVGDWMHRRLGGIAPRTPGYGEVSIAPLIGHGITGASARLETDHGPIAVSWEQHGEKADIELDLPDGVNGTLELPGGPPIPVTGRVATGVALP